jgi:A/G-specific adenine glycosylase
LNFTSALLSWYDQHARALPWRGSRDPYIIWVSEIIFQQTRIEQGTGYFLRFTERLPDLASLAAAEEDEVLRLWQGLGYYSRARNMLFTARHIRENLGGIFPSDFDSIKKLKGVGDYTASCIASICFGQVHAAVDGNVYRVLSRLSAEKTPIDSTRGQILFKKLAQQLISLDRPGDFNEAIMDLGATVCKPRNPACSVCPAMTMCKAYEMNLQAELPVKAPALKKSASVMNYLLLKKGEDILIQKREGKGIWNGLYELPMVPGDLDTSALVAECISLYGFEPGEMKEINRVKHVLSHAELDIRFYEIKANIPVSLSETRLLLVPAKSIDQYPFPKPLVDFLF